MTNEGEYRDTLTYYANMNDDIKDSLTYANIADSGSITIGSDWGVLEPKKGDDNMRYLYEVILVNPKNDSYSVDKIVAKTETSALMKAYNSTVLFNDDDFDDLKTSCRVLFEWKKEYPKTACE